MYCKNCGQQIDDKAVVCVHCGVEVKKNTVQTEEQSNSLALIGFILSFFIAIAGLICSIMGLKKSNELGGKGKGLAIAGIVISCIEIAMIVLYTIIAIALISSVAAM